MTDEPTTDAVVKVRDSGPYRLSGTFVLTDADGNAYPVEGVVALCRCGGSQTKPFCDGTHKTNGFAASERATPAEALP
ncbi:MAG TPA: CDGSH iron-sulfur domain-containing protein [Candidatus Acidoferrales bacterium]|nr:CDGSH iron-sulfur domain-containing protein [Candidatus Acidoferrales bacterium]